MSKIATYSLADTPLQLSDRLIGTEAPRTPPTATPLATKNFSLGELLQLFSANFPAATLQEVLDAGNTATEDINLTGNITSTLITPTNIEDVLGSQGATFQFLSKAANGINWVNLPVNYPTLDEVLTTGNVSTQDAKIGDLYLWDTDSTPGYAKVYADKNRIYFQGKTGQSFGYVGLNSLTLLDVSNAYTFSIAKPTTLTNNYTATFQNTSGTVAYLSDIPSQITLTTTGTSGPATLIGSVLNVPDYSSGISAADLNSVLAAGNTSSNYIVLTETGLDTYSELRGSSFSILDSVLPKQMVVYSDGLNFTSDGANYSSIEFIAPTKANTILFQDNSGTLAFLSDIPSYTIPSLQDVTDIGAITTNTITVGSLSGNHSQVFDSAIGTENNLTGTYAYLDNSGQLGLHNGAVESDLRNTNVTNVGVVLEFPNKPTGSYTIATTSDIPTNVGFEQNFLLMGA